MLLELLAVATAWGQEPDRSAPPTGEEMMAVLLETAPGIEVLDVVHVPRETDPEMAFSCGTARIAGEVEPFAVMARWQDPRNRITFIPPNGEPSPAPSVEWKIIASVPLHQDRDGDGSIGRLDRNMDAVARRHAMTFCPNLGPPEGVIWNTEIEPDPDRVSDDRNRRRARALTDLIGEGERRREAPETAGR